MIPAKEYRHPWVHRAASELSQMRRDMEYGMRKSVHTAKCPGIFTLQRHGWIMRTWQDITIETFGDGSSIQWTSAIDQTKLVGGIAFDAVGSHPAFQLRKYMERWPANTIDTLIKIQSPWRCNVPRGYYLLEMPVAYQDENRFTTVQGFFSHEQGPAQLNPQFMWHVMHGKELIRAGTPIAQYILVKKEDWEMTMNPLGEITEQAFFELVNNFRFVKSYGEVKKIYE